MSVLVAPTSTALLERPGRLCAVAASALNLTRVGGSGRRTERTLDGVSLNLQRGAFTAITGAPGPGPSTLLRCLAGLERPTRGRVFLGGTEITRLGRRELARLRRREVGFVAGSADLQPGLSAYENIALALDRSGLTPDATFLQATVTSLGLANRLDRRVSELTDDQRQRVAVARALVTRPAMLFVDAPARRSSQSDPDPLFALLRTAAEDFGTTVVVATHDPRVAEHADRVLRLSGGVVVDDRG